MRKVLVPKKTRPKTRARMALRNDADAWFSRRIRLRDSDEKGYCTCISCGERKHRKEMHNCHFITRSNYHWRRDPVNCNTGCASCNTYRQEYHMMKYTIKMIKWHGIKYVEKMELTHKEFAKVTREEMIEVISEYKEMVKNDPRYLLEGPKRKVRKLTKEEEKEKAIEERIREEISDRGYFST